ncbi:aspartate aminotransferase family protein [bacterium]|nr:aspartate aminotransferase family protein [bacterium]
MKASEIEIQRFADRTPSSKAALERGKRYLPLGVSSNFRSYPPHPVFVKSAKGGRFWDLDGNEYLDHNLSFGVLMAGHAHPTVTAAVAERFELGTMFGMPYELEQKLAEELLSRFPMDLIRFANSGTEATMHAIRTARGFTGRDKIIKMEGAYHGVHDSVLISYKPPVEKAGDPKHPKRVKASAGIPDGTAENTVPCQFNDLEALEIAFQSNRNQVAAVIVEPIQMNIGIAMPQQGYLQGVHDLCKKHGALLIFDEVKTGAKLARGGACEYFKVKPDMICLAKAIGGGFPLAAFGARREIMEVLEKGTVFHAGTYNANAIGVAAGVATLTKVLTPDVYPRISKLNQMLVDGYNDILKKSDLKGYAVGAGCNGTVQFCDHEVKNYRDWLDVDEEMWKVWWYGMLSRGILTQAYAWDEQWTICVSHTEADIEFHLKTFRELVPALRQAQDHA